MALTGKAPKNTYKDMFEIDNANAGVDSTLRRLKDGAGTSSAAYLSTLQFGVIDGTVTKPGFAFGSEASTGWYRATTAQPRFALAGVDLIGLSTTEFKITGNVVPEADNTRYLGNATKSFAGIYLGGNGTDVLDKYNVGTWTPTITATSGGGQTYTTQTGRSIRVGDLVFASFFLDVNSLGTLSGNARIDGLPFTSVNSNASGGGTLQIADTVNTTGASPGFGLRVEPNATAIQIYRHEDAAVSAEIQISEIGGTGGFYGLVVYEAA